MRILIIGGSSQDAFFLIRNHLANRHSVFATFRTPESMSWRQAQLQLALTPMEVYSPLVKPHFGTKELVDFVKINAIDLIYYMSAINLPRSIQLDREKKLMMRKIHFDHPVQVLKSIIESPGVGGVFPLSSKMFSLREDKDLIVSAKSAPNPQNYYGESRALFWDYMKVAREKNSLSILSPILFNHESKYRYQHNLSEKFAIQKLWDLLSVDTSAKAILSSDLDFDAREDWLNAEDVARAIFDLIELNIYEDIVISSGKGSSIYELLLDYYETKQDSESFESVNRKKLNSMKYCPCLVGDISRLGGLVGNIQRKIVLS